MLTIIAANSFYIIRILKQIRNQGEIFVDVEKEDKPATRFLSDEPDRR